MVAVLGMGNGERKPPKVKLLVERQRRFRVYPAWHPVLVTMIEQVLPDGWNRDRKGADARMRGRLQGLAHAAA